MHQFDDNVKAIHQAKGILQIEEFSFGARFTSIWFNECAQNKYQNGKAYLGCGAGSNISWFNIKTTNNIPNVYPFSSDCLAMAALSINPFILIKILI
ncbi:Type 1 glutamine amidotransferase-like domain-containing protein [Pedobacter agri]|uniref:Type 1 glutamine amidotransferase-like domain-containing protein n=1 Tax=Pedobacter agri TaxID=454586 RepID=UPI00292CEFEB|nr:Type 1 glutamine amidotransferase-like domain-containing protein [Pedobacter agri]